MNDVDLLLRVASDSHVEVINLTQSEPDGAADDEPTYRLRLRADMDRLIGFLRLLEDSGLRRVAIERLAARRQGSVWDADLELTSYPR